MKIYGKEYDRNYLSKRIGNIYQLGGTRRYELTEGSAKGTRAIDVVTGSGFNFTLIPDRGLDISQASFNGINMVYQTPNGEVNPAFYQSNSAEWLRVFFAGLLTTCGLTYFGAPGIDGGVKLGLHGRYSAIPARRVCDLSRWEGNEYIIEVTGTIEDSILFGEKLVMTRRITAKAGQKSLLIHDSVENYGSKPSPFTILYHINAGFPLLDKDAELLLTTKHTEPYNEFPKNDVSNFNRFTDPIANIGEQNFLHSMAGDEKGYARAAIINRSLFDGVGMYLKFKKDTLPYLSEWKMMGETDYVVGIEPCNTKCDNRGNLRVQNMLPSLKPGEKRDMEIEIGILSGKGEISEFEAGVNSIIQKEK